MSSSFIALNTLVLVGIIISAILTVYFDDLLSSIIALSAVGIFTVLEFAMLQAPDVAIAGVGAIAILTPVIYIIALKKIKGGKEE